MVPIGVNRESCFLADVDSSDVRFIHVGPDFEARQVNERHECRRRKVGRDCLTFLRRDRRNDARDWRDDPCIGELCGGVFEAGAGAGDLLFRDGSGALGEVQFAPWQNAVGTERALALKVGPRVGEICVRLLCSGGSLIPTRDEITIVELGEQLVFVDAISNPHIEALDHAGYTGTHTNLGTHAWFDDASGFDDRRDVPPGHADNLRCRRTVP
jgi:hypothetical protein